MTKRKKISVGASQPFAALLFLLLQRFVPTPAVSYYLSQELQSLFTSTYQKVTSHPHTQLKDEEEQQPTSSTEELLSSSWAARKNADSASSTGTKVRHQQGAQRGARWEQKKTMKTMRWKSWWETMQGYQLCNHWWEQWLWTLMCYWPRAKYTSCTWQPPALLKDKTMQSSSTSVGWFSVSVSNKNLDKW